MLSPTSGATQLISRRIVISNERALMVSSARAGVVFLYAHLFFHALHVAGRDPWFVTRLSRIPLFATCEASVLATLFTVLGAKLLLPIHDKEPARLANALLVAIAAFTLEIAFFP